LGGVAGHAGLFSTAEEVARLGLVYRNHGSHLGQQILAPLTVAEMTRQQAGLGGQRRGLAWNMWTPNDCSCGSVFGPRSYHTASTLPWIDRPRPAGGCLTNRVYHASESTGDPAVRPRPTIWYIQN
jgi:CubicO group peptidase (beta-lactamase class C family)